MKFTAGILNVCAVLMIIYSYPAIAKPVITTPVITTPKSACKSLAEMEKHFISEILKKYVKLNGKDLEPLDRDFSQLHIHSGPLDEKKVDAVCGVNYTIYALESIYKHQQQLNPKETDFLEDLRKTVRSLEERMKPCLEKVLSVRCQKHAKPEFPKHSDHYKRKQWSLAALQHMEKFFEELIKFINKHLHSG